MRPFIIAILLTCTVSCRAVKNGSYVTRSYVWVGKHLKREWPYVVDLQNGQKRLVFIGCDHIKDTTHRQFAVIEDYFDRLQPQLAFNEGGHDTAHYTSRNDGIRRSGETGCLKYLSDKAGVRLLSGDLSDTLEYSLMLRRYPKDKLFLYYVMERTVFPHLAGFNGTKLFADVYRDEVLTYYVNRGFPLAENERSLAYFEGLFLKYIGHPFKAEMNQDAELFDYVNGGNCEFCAIGRASKMLRDSILLTKINNAFEQYDRVIVTFGAGHALALEPALKQMMKRR